MKVRKLQQGNLGQKVRNLQNQEMKSTYLVSGIEIRLIMTNTLLIISLFALYFYSFVRQMINNNNLVSVTDNLFLSIT